MLAQHISEISMRSCSNQCLIENIVVGVGLPEMAPRLTPKLPESERQSISIEIHQVDKITTFDEMGQNYSHQV